MFGMKAMAWNRGDLEKLEVLQNRVGRLTFGASKWTAVEAIRGGLGWRIEETVEHPVLECSKYEHERERLIDVVHEQYGENKWNAKCVEGDSAMEYLVGLDEEYNMCGVMCSLSTCHRMNS
ncbi:hypothetical protein FHG87_023522 [Trinorchestia longiramus]|nr:hypothetical protein FHG87_023522 [Trinorchestia longiramus]